MAIEQEPRWRPNARFRQQRQVLWLTADVQEESARQPDIDML